MQRGGSRGPPTRRLRRRARSGGALLCILSWTPLASAPCAGKRPAAAAAAASPPPEALRARHRPVLPPLTEPTHLSGEIMLKTTRWATLAALLMVAASAAVTP